MNTRGLQVDQAPRLELPLRFFLTAPLFGMAAGMMLVWRGAALLLSTWSPQTIALTHLITLGVLTMVMLGALYQIIPVLVGSTLPRPGLGRAVHVGFCAGVLALAGGVLWGQPLLLWLALAALIPALLVFLGQCVIALLRAVSADVAFYSIAIALLALTLAAALGLAFVWEYLFGWFPLDRRALLAAHLYLALGGWIGTLITGLGQALFPMFYMSANFPAHRAWLVLSLQGLLPVTGILVAFLAPTPLWHLLPLAIGALSVGVFTVTVWQLLRKRRRKMMDVTLRFWLIGLSCAILALAALVVFIFRPQPAWLVAFGALFLLGFSTPIVIGMLYKIVAFLVWMHRFSHLAGKVDIPMMKDIIPPGHTLWHWRGYLAMLALFLLGLGSLHDAVVRIAGAALFLTFGGMAVILFRAALFNPPLEQPIEGGGDPP